MFVWGEMYITLLASADIVQVACLNSRQIRGYILFVVMWSFWTEKMKGIISS